MSTVEPSSDEGLIDEGSYQKLSQGLELGSVDRLPWWDDDDSAEDARAELASLMGNRYSPVWQNCLPLFRKQMAISTVYCSNHDGKLPGGLTHGVCYRILDKCAEDPDASQGESKAKWDADGCGTRDEAGLQLKQHMRALRYLCWSTQPGLRPLTPDMLRNAHAILMRGSVTCDGEPVEAGKYRLRGAQDPTGHVYLEAALVPAAVELYIQEFNRDAAMGGDSIQLTANLLYNLIHLVHPFEDGNRRLGGLLASYALMAGGTPFPVPLSDGHAKPWTHWEAAIGHCRRRADDSHLYLFLLSCLLQQWRNLEANCAVAVEVALGLDAAALSKPNRMPR